MSTSIYSAADNFALLKSLLLRAACVAAMTYIWFHYEENPTLMLIAGVVCLLVFLNTGDEQVIVYTDKIVQKDSSIASLILPYKTKVYQIPDIKEAVLVKKESNPLPTVPEVGAALLLSLFLPGRRKYHHPEYTTIILDMKNGRKIFIETAIGRPKMEKVVRAINSVTSDF